MTSPPAGSVRKDPPHIHLFWRFFFWDVRLNVDNFGVHMLNSGGFEPSGTGRKNAAVSLEGHAKSVDVRFMRRRNKKKKGDKDGVPIGEILTDLPVSTTSVTLKLQPPADHNSGQPAGPTINSPRDDAKWNGNFQVQMRPIEFRDLKLDADGYFVVDTGLFFDNAPEGTAFKPGEDTRKSKRKYAMHTAFVDPSDRAEGLAPNAYLKIYPRQKRRKKPDYQLIEVDWLFDVLRPTNEKMYMPKALADHYKNTIRKKTKYKTLSEEEKKAVDEQVKQANDSDPEGLRRNWFAQKIEKNVRGDFNEPFLVMHITTGNRVESAIWTLSGDAAIHYICCLNGHVIKMVEDSAGCHHAGWKDQAKWRDFQWGGSISVNKTSIGIEHVGVAGNTWPDDQVKGSVRIAKVICAHKPHSIAPVNVLRHRDLGGARKGAHEWGKSCPGSAAPWWAYQEAGVGIWPKGLRAGDPAVTVPTGPSFFEGVFDLVDEMTPTRELRIVPSEKLKQEYRDKGKKPPKSIVTTSKGPSGKYLNGPLKDPTPDNIAAQKRALVELKGYLTRIGYHPTDGDGKTAEDWTLSTMHCVAMCQQRFMIAPNTENAAAGGQHGPFAMPLFESHVCRDTAEIIWRVCQHDTTVLPDLKLRP